MSPWMGFNGYAVIVSKDFLLPENFSIMQLVGMNFPTKLFRSYPHFHVNLLVISSYILTSFIRYTSSFNNLSIPIE